LGANLFGCRLTLDGAFALGWPAGPKTICDAPGGQLEPSAALSVGGAIVAWSDNRAGNFDYDIYAAKITDDGTVPTTIALLEAQAEASGVRLRWFDASRSVTAAIVYRRTPASDWIPLAEARTDCCGYLAYDDIGVTPGGRYAYRLGVITSGAESFTAEVWVDVPRAPRLAIQTVRPNPSAGPLRIGLSLVSTRTATLEIFDVRGRRLSARVLPSMPIGDQVLDCIDCAGLPAGLYWLRLSQDHQAATARIVLTP
jgi:hypothetical protein